MYLVGLGQVRAATNVVLNITCGYMVPLITRLTRTLPYSIAYAKMDPDTFIVVAILFLNTLAAG
jgi:hypothetical protein